MDPKELEKPPELQGKALPLAWAIPQTRLGLERSSAEWDLGVLVDKRSRSQPWSKDQLHPEQEEPSQEWDFKGGAKIPHTKSRKRAGIPPHCFFRRMERPRGSKQIPDSCAVQV